MAKNNRQTAKSKSKSVVNRKGKTLTRSGTVKLGKNEGMREGRKGARGYSVGKDINKRDIKEMQAQGFTDKKIKKVLSSKNKEVRKGADKWLNQQNKGGQTPPNQQNPGQSTPQPPASPEPENTPTPDPTDTTPSPAPTETPDVATPAPAATDTSPETPVDPNEVVQNGGDFHGGDYREGDYREGDKELTYSPDNSMDYDYDGGEGNINGNDNQGGNGNTNVRDTGDITQETDNTSSQQYENTQDNDNTQDMSNNSGTINNNQQFDNSIRNYGGSVRNFTYNSANTGAGGSGGGSGSGVETPGTMATLGGFYDVDDSPAEQAKFVDMHSTINSDLQKGHTNRMSGTAQTAIDNASNNAYIDAQKMDNRIMARQKASMAQANVMGANFFGDQASWDLDWNQPDKADEPEKPDFESTYDKMTNF